MVHICAACNCQADEINEAERVGASQPEGWFIRCIDDTDYLLCDICGHQSHFRGGISPYLMDMLELMEGARCDLSAEAAALGVERRRFRKRS